MNRLQSLRPDQLRRSRVALVLALGLPVLCLPTGARGQLATRFDVVSARQSVAPELLYPDYRQRRELTLSGVGAGILVTSFLVQVATREVPAQGLDPADITWSLDRGIVGNNSLDADAASDLTLLAAVLFPAALALATGQSGRRWSGLGRRGLVYAETFFIRFGVTRFAKTMLGRPRPYAYLSEEERPDGFAYDVTTDRTFHSMPSGHSSSAWSAATLGMTEHLLSRPQASWIERAGVGFLGGTFAGMTSALRVAAGQHFPSDVMVAAGIGIAAGVTLPLVHRGGQALPPPKAWAQMMGGTVAGALAGILLARGY